MKNCSRSLFLPSPRACLPALSQPIPRAFLLQAEQSWHVPAPSKKPAEHLRRTSPYPFSSPASSLGARPVPAVWGPVLVPRALLRSVDAECHRPFQVVLCCEMFCSWTSVLTVNNFDNVVTWASFAPLHVSLPGALMTVLTSLLPCTPAPWHSYPLVCLLLVVCSLRSRRPGERLSSCPTTGSFLQSSSWKMVLMPNMLHWPTHLYAQRCWLHQGAAMDFWGTTLPQQYEPPHFILF